MGEFKIKGCKVKRTAYESIEIVGPMARSKEAVEKLHDEGWSVVAQGPYTDAKIFPKVDASRFAILARREIKPNP